MIKPRCICGDPLAWYGPNLSWTCPKTLDHQGHPRPRKGHLHFVDPEDVLDNGDIRLGLAERMG